MLHIHNTVNLTWTKLSRLAICMAGVALLAGCSTGAHSIIPEEGLTMDSLYDHAIGDNRGNPRQDLKLSSQTKQDDKPIPALNYVGYTRTSRNEINSQFKALPDPSIPIFIYPHFAKLNDEQLPIPGYTTTFFLYKQNQYAMSTEVY